MNRFSGNVLRWVGVVVAVLYWVLESLLELPVYGGNFVAHLLPTDPNELWMRSMITVFFVVCGFAAQIALDRRRNYEQELRRREERYRTVVDTAQDAIITMAEDGRIRSLNPAAERIFGYAEEEAAGQPLTLLMPERFRDLHEAGFRRYLATREPRVIGRMVELAGLRKNGEEFPLELSLAETRESGEVIFTGIIRDITERKRAEESLRQSEFGLAEAQRLAHLGNWEWDVVTGELYWSNEVYRIYGYQPGEFVPTLEKLIDLVHPDDRALLRSNMDAALYEDKPYDFIHRMVLPSGEVRFVHRRAEVVRDEEGEPLRMIGTVQDITENRLAEKALRESEERYEIVARATNDVIWDVNLRTNHLKWMGAVRTMFGYSTDEVRAGQWWEDRLHPEDRQRVISGIEGVMAGEDETWSDEYRFLCGDGSYASVMDRAFVIRDEGGEAIRIIGSMMDVTERKEAEARLQEAELRYRTLVEQIPAVVYTQTPGYPSRTTYISPWIEKLQGYTPEEILADPEHWVTELHPDDRDRVLAEDTRTNETGEPFKMEYRVISKDGRVAWVRDEAEIVRDESGEPIIWQGIMTDITRRKQDEEEIRRLNENLERQVAQRTSELEDAIARLRENERVLRESEERFRLTFEQAAVGVSHVGTDGRWLRVNDKLCEIVGYSREELLGMSFRDITHPDDLDRDFEHVRRMMEGETDTYSAEKRYIKKDSSIIWINLTTSLLRDPFGEPRYFISVTEDITDRRRAEDALRVLVKTSAVLTSSLDYRKTLADLAHLVVPGFADWCVVDVLDKRGIVQRLAAEHDNPEKVSLARELHSRYPPDPDAPGGISRVLRDGESEFYPEITDEMLVAAARDSEHLETLREIGFTSEMIVPLVARGRTLGAISFVSAESGRRYGSADLELAEVLGRRAALAVDNARLYEEAQEEISWRKRIEEELRGSRDQLDIILRGVGDGITAQDPSGRLIYANMAAARIVGYPTAEEFLEAPLTEVMKKFEVMDEDGRPLPLTELPGRKALRDRENASELVRFREVETGQERWTFVSAAPVLDEEGRVQFAVNIFRDITDRIRTEETLREVREAERNRLSRDLHDVVLQDMIDAMHSLEITQMKARDTEIRAELEQGIESLERSVLALRNSVYNLRLQEDGDYPFINLLEALVNLNRQRNPACEIDLEIENGFPDTLSPSGGVELMNVIREALVNVRRHSGARHARITLGLDGGQGWIEVADDGAGFDPSAVRSSTGLAAMRERAANLRGELRIESVPGRGTSVRFRVPLDALLPILSGERK